MFFFIRRPDSECILPLVSNSDELRLRLDSGGILPSDEYWDYEKRKYENVENLAKKLFSDFNSESRHNTDTEEVDFDDFRPRKFKHFELLNFMGDHALGADYLCVNNLKVRYKATVFLEVLSSDTSFTETIQERVKDIALLTQFSKWCVRYIDSGVSGQNLFLVKELADWARFESIFNELQNMSWYELYCLFWAIAKALKNLHDLGFVHGLLGPKTILVRRADGEWNVKLDSYCLMPENGSSIKKFISHLSADEKEYLAPELTTSYKISRASDVYSFGKLFKKSISDGIFDNVSTSYSGSKREFNQKIQEFLSSCLSISRGTRLPDAGALVNELEKLIVNESKESADHTSDDAIDISSVLLSTSSSAATSVCFSPNGKLIADAGGDGLLQVWNSKSGIVKFSFRAHEEAIHSISFCPTSKFIASASEDGTVKIWDLTSGNQVSFFELMGEHCYSVSFSPNGEQIAIGSSSSVISLWDVKSGELVSKFFGHKGAVRSLTFSNCGNFLSSGAEDNNVIVWNIESEEKCHIFEFHEAPVLSVSYSSDGQQLNSIDEAGECACWNLESRSRIFDDEQLEREKEKYLKFSPNGEYLVSVGRIGNLRLLHATSREVICNLVGHHIDSGILCIGFSQNTACIVSSGEDCTTRLWDVSSVLKSAQENSLLNTRKAGRSEQSEVFVTAIADRLNDLTVEPVLAPPVIRSGISHLIHGGGISTSYRSSVVNIGSPVHSVVMFPNIGFFAVGCADQQIRIYSLNSTSQPVLSLGCHGIQVKLALSECGGYLAYASGTSFFRIYNVRKPAEKIDNRLFKELGGNMLNLLLGNPITSIAYSKRGQIATSGLEGSVHVWSVSTGTRKSMNRGTLTSRIALHDLCFSNDGELLFAAGEDVCILDVATGHNLGRFAAHGDWVRTVIQSPDSKTLTTSGDDGVIRFWKAPTDRSQVAPKSKGRIVASREGQILALAYSSSGNILVSGGSDCLVKIWSPQTRSELGVYSGHTKPVTSLALFNDDESIISGSEDGTVRIWTKLGEEEVS
jgi:WD40 repeat protein